MPVGVEFSLVGDAIQNATSTPVKKGRAHLLVSNFPCCIRHFRAVLFIPIRRLNFSASGVLVAPPVQ